MADMGNQIPEATGDHDVDEQDASMLDKLRHSPVGTNDPMIVGDAGPTDVPPGSDGDADPLLVTNDPALDETQ